LSDPVELRIVLELLKPNGALLVVTPNAKGLPIWALSLKRRIFGLLWCPIDDMPWHPRAFTPRTMMRELEQDFRAAERETSVVEDGSTDHAPDILRKFMPCMRALGKVT
jgi:hypothetical protein